ncbi:hypothetical protein VT85_01985 [Planctomyces sp. SH-PL62]|nr:hypothetical protein VT85_01985 [Planctomyces sp. SH-PL62]
MRTISCHSTRVEAAFHVDPQTLTPALMPVSPPFRGGVRPMPRRPKLRRRSGYWSGDAGGTTRCFGKIGEVPFEEAWHRFREFLAGDGRPPTIPGFTPHHRPVRRGSQPRHRRRPSPSRS